MVASQWHLLSHWHEWHELSDANDHFRHSQLGTAWLKTGSCFLLTAVGGLLVDLLQFPVDRWLQNLCCRWCISSLISSLNKEVSDTVAHRSEVTLLSVCDVCPGSQLEIGFALRAMCCTTHAEKEGESKEKYLPS